MRAISELTVTKIKLLSVEIDNLVMKMEQIKALGDAKFAERSAMVEQARKQAKAPEKHLFDVDKGVFVPPPEVNS